MKLINQYLQQRRAMLRSKDGAALILAILATAILTVLAVGLVDIVRVEVIASRSAMDRLQARYIAKAGFNLARSVLMYEDDFNVDSTQDEWFKLKDQEPLLLGTGWCHISATDTCSLINVNSATEEMLSELFRDPAIAKDLISTREERGAFLSLGEFFDELNFDETENIEFARLLTVQSFERNVAANGSDRVNINETDPSTMVRLLGLSHRDSQSILRYRRTLPEQRFRSCGELLDVPLPKEIVKDIFDKVCLDNTEFISGRVNLNTAQKEVLTILPGSSLQIAEAIISNREQKEGGFASSAELLDLPEVTKEDFIALSETVCTKSSSYIIETTAGLENKPTRVTLQGTVLRMSGPIAPLIYGLVETPMLTYASFDERS